MLEQIIRFSVKRPKSVLLIALTLLVLGLIALSAMSVDYLPSLKIPKLTVVATYEGLPAKEMRELFTIPLEDTLSGASGLKSMKSVSKDGVSLITLEFAWGSDIVQTGVTVRQLIDVAYINLPSGAEKPIVLPVDPNDKPVLTLGVFPVGETTLSGAKRLAERELKTLIQQIDGVGSVSVTGGQKEEIHVLVDARAAAAKGVNVDQIATFLSSDNQEYPAGSFIQGKKELIVKADNKADSLQALGEHIFVTQDSSSMIPLKTISKIENGFEDKHAVFFDGEDEGIALKIQRRSLFSPVKLSENFFLHFAEIQKTFQGKLKLKVIEDSSQSISETVNGLILSIVLGSGITFLILWFFLRQITSSLIVLFLIPLSITISFVFLYLFGVNLNIMSLGGIDISIGMLVDTGVVILGNLSLKADRHDSASIESATVEMARPLLGATLTSFIVFLPLVFLPGLLGGLFSSLSLAVIAALSVSYLASITLLPALYRFIGKRSLSHAAARSLDRTYRSTLRFVFRRPIVLFLVIGIFAAISVIVFPWMHTDWLQSIRSNQVEVVVKNPSGTSIDWLETATKASSRTLLAQKGVLGVTSWAGGNPDDPTFLADETQRAENVHYKLKLETTFAQDLEQVRTVLTPLLLTPGATIQFSYPSPLLTDVLPFHKERKRYILRFPDLNSLEAVKSSLQGSLLSGTRTLYPNETKSNISLKPRRELFAKGAQNLQNFSSLVATSLHGRYVGTMESGGIPIDIRVMLPEKDRASLETLQNLAVPIGKNQSTPLMTLAEPIKVESSALIVRENRKDSLYLDISANDASGVIEPFADMEILDPEGVEFKEMSGSILLVFLLALLLLYLVLGAQFESFSLPILLMAAIPIGILGVVFTLFVTNSSLNLNSTLGMLVILGALANHSIIFYDIFHNTKPKVVLFGVYHGASVRFRPILVTLLTTVLALLPTAFDPGQTNPQSSLATAIIGGLSISTLIAFYLTPYIFFLYLKRKKSASS